MKALCLTLLLCAAASGADRIDLIEFFGYEGMPVEALRQALPIREGGMLDDKMRAAIHETVKKVTGSDATDVVAICCTEHGHSVLFIGLPGKSTRTFRLNPKPEGAARLSREFLALDAKLQEARNAAVKKGGDAAQEDDSQGYALSRDPATHGLQLQLRDYARRHENEIYQVLETGSDAQQRARAAVAIGYAARTPRQLGVLLRASRDADAGVRDEATRDIGVLLQADPAMAKQIPAADFIEMAASGNWMDRNKAAMVLEAMTEPRDRELLAQIEKSVWIPLLEMARWRDTPHAAGPRMILGRIRGMSEDAILDAAFETPEAFLKSIGEK